MSSIWTTVEVTADLEHAAETLRVRANLSDAAGTVYVDYRTGQGRKADWQPTQFQTADARHRTSGLAAIGERLMASALETPENDLETTWEDITAICDVADVLMAHGERFSGGSREQAEDLAAEWVDAEFTADEVEAWAAAGVWDADTAAILHNNDMKPADVLATAALLVKASDDPAEEFTDGDPVYSVCNGDTSVDVLIAAFADV